MGQEKSFNSEFYGGINFHTSGWGGNLNYSKHITSNKRQIISVDLISLKHGKQQKIRTTQREKRYVYGKLNSIYVLRGSYGRKVVLANDFNNKGLEVSLTYTGGLSVAGVKPIYLNIVNPFSSQSPTLERYDPEKHTVTDIYSGGPNFSGINELKPIFGINSKIGFLFDYSPYKNYVRN